MFTELLIVEKSIGLIKQMRFSDQSPSKIQYAYSKFFCSRIYRETQAHLIYSSANRSESYFSFTSKWDPKLRIHKKLYERYTKF